jgi:DNA-binding Lrp family transcriptional regulator
VSGESSDSGWTLLTGHGHVLIEVARNPDARVRDIAQAVNLTERAIQGILADLEAAGYLTRDRHGRRNRYLVHSDSPYRHSHQDGHLIGPLLALLAVDPGPHSAAAAEGSGTAQPDGSAPAAESRSASG